MAKVYRPPSLSQTIRAQRAQIRKLGSTATLARSGLSVTGEGETTVDGNLVVTGDFTAEGKISNDALINPILGDAALGVAYNFVVDHVGTTPLVSQSWYVPAGFTRAHIYVTARIFAINSTAGLDYLYARSRAYVPVGGAVAMGVGIPIAATGSGGSAFNVSPVGLELFNLTDGQEIRLEVQGWTAFASWAASVSNTADVAGQITWTR